MLLKPDVEQFKDLRNYDTEIVEIFATSGNLIGNALAEKFLRKERSRDFATNYWREFMITLQNTAVNCLGLLRFGYHSTTI